MNKTETNKEVYSEQGECELEHALRTLLKPKGFKNSKNSFSIDQKDNSNFVPIKCQSCNYLFGIKSDYLDLIGEANFRYSCPYCHFKGSLKN